MSMAAESSSMIQRPEQVMAALPASSPLIKKSMNFNLPIKLNRDNYIYWKANVMPNIWAIELDDFITSERQCPSKFVEYDSVVVLVSQQRGITFHGAQYMLMIHEQQIEHLSAAGSVDFSPSANFVNNSGGRGILNNNRGGGQQRGGNNGGRGPNGRGKEEKDVGITTMAIGAELVTLPLSITAVMTGTPIHSQVSLVSPLLTEQCSLVVDLKTKICKEDQGMQWMNFIIRFV
ncbi:hypothetical protein ACOSP7_031936 [Xanthoceras sorbifolium]